ncbi:unnamed protein product [Durusdinium trenchii]|uniref:Peptidase A1 domain-containing protein n=1 Tax=Durusdinium trenchii TaxID=1381693 RepID=A0ABP0SSS8_9DINO
MCRSATCLSHRRYRRRASLVAQDIDVDGTPVLPNQARDQITVSYGTGEITGIFVQDKVCLGPKKATPATDVRARGAAVHAGMSGSATGASLLQLDRARLQSASQPLEDEEEAQAEHGCVDLRLVSATDMTEDPFSSFRFDGVLGLGLPSLSQTLEFNFLEASSGARSWTSLVPDGERMFGVFLAKSPEEESEITFGGWKSEHMTNGSELAFCNVQDSEEGYWQLDVFGIKANGQVLDFCAKGCRAVVDTGSSLLGVPSDLGDQLVDLLRHPAHEGACGTRSSGPVLEIDLGNFTVVLDPTDYARLEFLDEDGDDEGETSRNSAEDSAQDAASEPESSGAGAQGAVHPAGEQTCVPMVMHIDLPPPLHERTLILGEPVLQRYYTVFDADGERPRVGFAPARHQLEAVAEAPEVPADLEAEAKRLLQWANSDAAWRGPPPASSAAPNPSVAVRGASAAAGSSYLGGCEDPFAELLAQSDGVASGFCEVPVMLLRRIRAEGQAQLAEIAELRAQLAKLPEVEEEVAEMEAELQELQTNCVVNANEIELRKMEAETLASEAVRLKDEKQQRMKRLEALTAQATKIVVFLKAAVVQDVHISIKYAGICHSDIHQEWGKGIFPMVPGHEIAGVVESVGEGVTKFKVGDKVGVGVFVDSCRQCSACKSGDENYCEPGMVATYNGRYNYKHCEEYDEEGGAPTYGGYSQSITVDEAYVLKIPDGMDMAGAAPLLCAGITVYAPMVFHNLKPGMKLAVAGLGGLGAMAVLIGKAMGAEVTVLTRSAAKKTGTLGRPGGRSGHRLREEALKGLKADKVVVVTDEDEAKSVKGYFNMMINTISAQYDLSAYLDMLANAGKFIMVGLPSEPLSLKGFGIVGERKMVAGSKIGNIKETQDMLDFCAKHGITCPHELIPADPAKVNEAYERAIKSDVRYRFVIDTSTNIGISASLFRFVFNLCGTEVLASLSTSDFLLATRQAALEEEPFLQTPTQTVHWPADEIEFWLDAAGHAPAGPEGRARVERYRAAAQQAAQQAKAATASAASAAPGGAGSAASAAESGPAEAAAAGSALRGSADVPVLTLEQWKEAFQKEEISESELKELDAFFARINPTGRATTPPELLAAAGNPKLGLARHLRGLVAKVVSQQGKPTAEGETAAKPGEAENASATAVPAEAAAAKAEKASPPAPEPHGSKACKMVFLDLTL